MQSASGLEAARAALHAGGTQLISPPYAACHAGVNYYRKLLNQLQREFADVDFSFTLCCGDDPAIAHDALRLGFKHIVCDCGDAVYRELQAAAERCGAEVVRNYPALDPAAKAAKPA